LSAMGLVSRVTPVHTALRNCTRDEGRSFEVGNQVLISNHRKLLWPKSMVVNVAEKSERDSGRYDWERRAQANRCRSPKPGVDPSSGISLGDVLRLPKRHQSLLPDPINPYRGGMVNLGGAKLLGNVLSSEDTAKYWAKLLG